MELNPKPQGVVKVRRNQESDTQDVAKKTVHSVELRRGGQIDPRTGQPLLTASDLVMDIPAEDSGSWLEWYEKSKGGTENERSFSLRYEFNNGEIVDIDLGQCRIRRFKRIDHIEPDPKLDRFIQVTLYVEGPVRMMSSSASQ